MYYTYAYCYPDKQSNLLSEYGCDFQPFYIGYGTNKRYLSHLTSYNKVNEKKSNPVKCAKIRNIIDQGLVPHIQILKRFENKIQAIEHEIYLINNIGTIVKVNGVNNRGPLSNLHLGGNGGNIPKTSDGLKRLSEKLKGRIINAEWREKISNSKTGNTHHSQETRKIISEQTKEALKDPLKRKIISNTHKNKPKSQEHKLKLSKHLTEMNKDPKINARKLQSKIQNNTLLHSEETKNKISKSTKQAMSKIEVIDKMKASSRLRWQNESEKINLANKNSKTFKLTHKISGESFIIKNLAQYCRDNKTHHRKVHLEYDVIVVE